MKDNLTEIVFILDESGSMWQLAEDTIGGFNSYVDEQRRQPGEARLTTVAFNTGYRVIHNNVNIKEVPALTDNDYNPCGGTALFDAVGKTITSVGQRLAAMDESERPSKVIMVITTDGQENSSQEYSRAQIQAMVQHQREKYSWEFVFIGAGIDGYAEAENIGIGTMCAMSVTADKVGSQNMFKSVAFATNSVRSGATIDSLGEQWKTGDVGK